MGVYIFSSNHHILFGHFRRTLRGSEIHGFIVKFGIVNNSLEKESFRKMTKSIGMLFGLVFFSSIQENNLDVEMNFFLFFRCRRPFFTLALAQSDAFG